MIMNVVLRFEAQAIGKRQIRLRPPFVFGIESSVEPAHAHIWRSGGDRKLRWTILRLEITRGTELLAPRSHTPAARQ